LIACNGTIVNDTEMGEVIQLQGDQRKDVQEFLVDKKEGLELDAKTIKVREHLSGSVAVTANVLVQGPWFLNLPGHAPCFPIRRTDRSPLDKLSFLLLAAPQAWNRLRSGVKGAFSDTHE
jgi:hypothetical protein